MGGFSLWHILIFAVIVLLLFGGNRFSAMMGDVAKGLKSFKKGMTDDDEVKPDQRPVEQRQIPPQEKIGEGEISHLVDIEAGARAVGKANIALETGAATLEELARQKEVVAGMRDNLYRMEDELGNHWGKKKFFSRLLFILSHRRGESAFERNRKYWR